jgi:hypothetical protein
LKLKTWRLLMVQTSLSLNEAKMYFKILISNIEFKLDGTTKL